MRLLALMLALFVATAVFVVGTGRAQSTTAPSKAAPAPGQDVSPAVAEFMKPIEVAAGDDALRQKMKERHNTAVRLLALRVEERRKGIVDAQTVFDAARVVAEAKADLAQNDDERRAVLEQMVQASKDVESRMERQVQAGVAPASALEQARLARLGAEVQLLKLKQSSTSSSPAPTTRGS